jgi:phage tail tape-measure protein
MSSKQRKTSRSEAASKLLHEHEAEASVAGALGGAAMGAIAGPMGAVAGAIIGGALGAGSVAALASSAEDDKARNDALDAAIGVSEGEIGAPNLDHPAAVSGAYSTASTGGSSSSGDSPAEGPIQEVDS